MATATLPLDVTSPKRSAMDPDGLRRLTFANAAPVWLETRRMSLDPKTFYGYERNIVHLNKIFGTLTVEDINLAHLRRYQRMRSANLCMHDFPRGEGCPNGCSRGLWVRPGGPSCVNHELTVVQQILKRAGLWAQFADHFEPVPPPKFEPPKVMTELEEKRFFAIAASNPDWHLAGMVATLTANTTASGKELRMLRMGDVDLEADPPRLHIPVGKNSYRIRTIALNATAASVVRKLRERAITLGSSRKDHFLFPYRSYRNQFDPTRPASSSWLRRSWHELREAAMLPWLTPHCLRHQAITSMAERGIPPEVIRATAGHVSEQMMRHYCHTRLETQHAYLQDLGGHASPFSSPSRELDAATKGRGAAVVQQHRSPLIAPPQVVVIRTPAPALPQVKTTLRWGSTSSTF